uniref:C-type lectin domain-containing protein n=1 Tax=Strigamia maritima TaxID=126957 RepID=T1JD98_STRMM
MKLVLVTLLLSYSIYQCLALVCPEGFVEIHNGCYYFSEKRTNFFSALQECKSLNASLLSIETIEENFAIKMHLFNHYKKKQTEQEDGSQDNSTTTHNPSDEDDSGDSLQPSCTPSGSYYPLVKHPVYTLAFPFPLPHVFHPNFAPQNSYRPLQPLDWYNQRIPASCQIYHAMAPPVPSYIRPTRSYQNPFYWNTVLINPYSNFTSTQTDTENSTSGYIYPGHYYGPASLSSTNDVTPNPKQRAENNTSAAGERRIQSKKRKRKRKRKLRLKTTPTNSLGDTGSLMDEEIEMQQENNVEVCQIHMSRDHLLRLPLIDDLFAVTLVDEIVSNAIEIALQREEKLDNSIEEDEEDEKVDNSISVGSNVVGEEKSIQDIHLDHNLFEENEEADDLEVTQLMMGIGEENVNYSNISSPVNSLTDSREQVEEYDNDNQDANYSRESDRNMMNSGPDSCDLDWSQRNGHVDRDDGDDGDDGNGERELVTEIVFISETSFMDEAHAPENNEEEAVNDQDVEERPEEAEEEKEKEKEKESPLSESDKVSTAESTEEEEEEEEEEDFIGETYMGIDDHQQFYDPHKVKDYYQICTNMDVPDSPLDKSDKSDKSAQPAFEVVATQPLPVKMKFKEEMEEKEKEKDLPNRHAEIVVHELDDVSECGSEDVDLIGHRYQKSETSKNIYVNQLSLAAELLKSQQDIPYDKEFKPIEDAEAQSQNTATTSHSNRHVYDNYYGTLSGMEMRSINCSTTESCKEVSDSGVQSEESGDEEDAKIKAMAQGGANRSAYKGVLGTNAKPLSSMLKGKGNSDPLCLCCSVM